MMYSTIASGEHTIPTTILMIAVMIALISSNTNAVMPTIVSVFCMMSIVVPSHFNMALVPQSQHIMRG